MNMSPLEAPPVLPGLVSPVDGSPLVYDEQGRLRDQQGNRFPVIGSIPRFVPPSNYTDSFGLQWNLFRRTQLDKFSGTHISRDRLCHNTRWSPSDLRDQVVLEAGSGAGRFTQILLEWGCRVYSVDYSTAIDANAENNGPHPRLHLFQADILALPFAAGFFDRILCFGVLQHTPDPARAFQALIPLLKPGGEIAVDIYARTWRTGLQPYRWYRPMTRRLNPRLLLASIRRIAPVWLPLSTRLMSIPKAGYLLAHLIPIVNYSRVFPQLSPAQQLEWTILDTFDNLTPVHDHPQSLATFRAWFEQAGFEILYCGPGDNGWVGVGRNPCRPARIHSERPPHSC